MLRTSTTCSHARRFKLLARSPVHAKPPPPPHRSPSFLPSHRTSTTATRWPEQNDFEEEEFAGAWKQTGAAASRTISKVLMDVLFRSLFMKNALLKSLILPMNFE
ncbi:hypothetical protein SO802_032632 [Lithocarpus litseifolius]|uniref:Uncharacterized protein n=1 Tax=Lithocarpus litseifolius TaxID=425828 RepID=A0AAW2BDL8_9ROSI